MDPLALHKAVRDDNIAQVLDLLTGETDPNNKQLFEGVECAAIHVCARRGRMLCLKALLILGADINLQDGNGDSARHIISTSTSNEVTEDNRNGILDILANLLAARCEKNKGCGEGCRSGAKFNGKYYCRGGTVDEDLTKRMQEEIGFRRTFGKDLAGEYQGTDNRPRMLCLDAGGGGVRALVQLVMLKVLESHFQGLDVEPVGIHEYFDLFVGSSSGGVIALMLAKGNSVIRILKGFLKLKDVIFRGVLPPYDPGTHFDDFLKANLETETKLKNLTKKVIIFGTKANVKPPEIMAYENITPADRNREMDDRLWEIGKKTGVATGLVALHQPVVIDGGFKASNPTVNALVQLSLINKDRARAENENGDAAVRSGKSKSDDQDKMWKVVKIVPDCVISLGTSMEPERESTPQEIDPDWTGTFLQAAHQALNLLPLLTMLAEEVIRAEGRDVEEAQSWCRVLGVPLMRVNPPTHSYVHPDDTDNTILINLMYDAFRYMHENTVDMNTLYALLKR